MSEQADTLIPRGREFLDGGGELGERMRAFDWNRTPLGPPEDWPQPLKSCVRIMLTSRHSAARANVDADGAGGRAEEQATEVVNALESMPDGFAAFDRDWQILYLNAAAEQLAGVSRQDLLSRNLWEEYPDTVEAPIGQALTRVMRDREPATFEVNDPDQTRWVEVTANPIDDGGITVYLRDVTERKRAEAEVQSLRTELATDLSAMERLHELSTRLLSATELPPLLDEILAAAIELEHADFGTIHLLDPQTGALEFAALRGVALETLQTFAVTDPAQTARGRAMRQRERVVIEDIRDDDAYAPLLEKAAEAGFRAVHSTPLFGHAGEILGALSTHFREPHRPSERELRLIDLYARLAGETIERSRAEARLSYQAHLLDMASDAVIAYDSVGGITYWNSGAERVYGWPADVATSKAFADLVAPGFEPQPRPDGGSIRDQMHAGHAVQGEFLGQRSDGRLLSIEHSSRALFEPSGAVSGYLSVHRDITERKRLVEELLALRNDLAADLAALERLHELSLRLMSASELQPLLDEILSAAMEIQQADLGVIQLYNEDTGLLDMVAQYGFDEQLLAQFVRGDDGISPRARALASRARCTVGDVLLDAQFAPALLIAAEAGFRAVDATPLFGHGGQILGVLATYFREPHRPSERELRLTDLYAMLAGEMIERGRTDQALAYQAHLLEMASDAIIASDTASRITFWNTGAERVYGWAEDEVLGRSPDDIFPPVEAADLEREQRDARLRSMHGGSMVQGEYQRRHKDGRPLWIEYSARAFFDQGEQLSGYVSVHRDITERKRAEAELGSLRNALAADLAAMVRLYELSTRLIPAAESQPLLDEILSAAIELQGADLGALQLLDPATGTLQIVAQLGFEPDVLHYFTTRSDEASASGRARRERQRVIVEDVEVEATYAPHRAIAARAGYRAIQSTPLFGHSGELLGLLTTYFSAPHRPTERELRLTDLYARQAGEMIERGRVEQQLAEQAFLLAHVSDAVIGVDLDFYVTYWSPSAQRQYGYSADEVLGRRTLELFNSVNVTMPHEEALQQLLKHGHIELEVIQTTKDGRRIDIESHITLIRDGRGAPTGMLAINRDITERKRTAQQLAEQAFLLTNVSDAVIRFDFDSRIIYWGPSAERLYGFSADEALGQISTDLLQSTYLNYTREEAFAELRREGRLVLEVAQVARDGSRIDVESHVTLLPGRPGEPDGILAISRDITQRKQAEAALRASEERLRRALEIETVGVMFFRPDGTITGGNDAFLRMSGYSRAEFEQHGLRWDKLTAPEWLPRTIQAMDEFLTTGRSAPYEKQYIRKNGTRWWALFATTRLNDDDDEGVKFIVDISEAKRAEESLRASEERFRTVANLVPDLLWSGDARGNTTWYSRRWHEYTGQSDAEAAGDGWIDVVHPDDLEAAVSNFRNAIAAGQPLRQEHRLRRADGEYRWFLFNDQPVRDESGAIVQWLGAATDIQEQRAAMELLEARVAEATVELRDLSRRLLTIQEEERRHLARELHDEVGQALTGLSLTLATARRGGDQRQLDHAVTISDELLERVRLLSLDLRPSVLDDLGLLPALLSHVERYTLRTGVRVDMRHRGLDQRYDADVETAAYRIIQEALTNVARHAETDAATVRVVADEWLTVHVGDQGRGFQVDDSLSTGRSSGLSGMRERVTLLGGRISVESAPGEGTIVVAELPLSSALEHG